MSAVYIYIMDVCLCLCESLQNTQLTAQQLPADYEHWAAEPVSVLPTCGVGGAVPWCRRKHSLTATRCLSVLVQYKMCDVCNVCSSYETFEGPLVFSVLMLILWWAAAAIKMQMFAMFANLDSREKEVVDKREERRPYLLTTQAFSWPVESINKICKTLISFDLVPFFPDNLVSCRCVDIHVSKEGKGKC